MKAQFFAAVVCCSILTACGGATTNNASGTLEHERVSLTAPVSEVITDIFVAEGSVVEKGEVIAQLDPSKKRAALQKAEAVKAQAKAYLEQLQNGERQEDVLAAKAQLAQVKATLAEANKRVNRLRDLVKQTMATQADLDSAMRDSEVAQANVEAAAQSLLKLQQGTRSELVAQAQFAYAASEADLALAQTELDELTIKATRTGRLDALPFEVGERVVANTTVAIILTQSPSYARIYVPELYKAKMTQGREVEVAIDGVTHSLTGRVRWVSHDPAFTPYRTMNEADRSRLVYLAEIDLPEQADNLAIGIPVQMNLDQL